MWAAPLNLEPGENVVAMKSVMVLALNLVGMAFYVWVTFPEDFIFLSVFHTTSYPDGCFFIATLDTEIL